MLSKFIAVILICALTAFAQDQNFFPKPGYFRETLITPDRHIELKPPTRLADFVVDGKIELSLRSYIELVMANNTSVAVTKLIGVPEVFEHLEEGGEQKRDGVAALERFEGHRAVQNDVGGQRGDHAGVVLGRSSNAKRVRILVCHRFIIPRRAVAREPS